MPISDLRHKINLPSPIGLIPMTPWGILNFILMNVLKKMRMFPACLLFIMLCQITFSNALEHVLGLFSFSLKATRAKMGTG